MNHELESVVTRMDDAFNRGDVDALLEFYEDDAAVAIEPDRIVFGKEALRVEFSQLVSRSGTARQVVTRVVQAGDIALYMSRWIVGGRLPDGSPFAREAVATSVFRRQSDGGWKCLVDNPFGPRILDC